MTTNGDAKALESVLVLAPTGRDGPLTVDVLCRAGIGAELCRGVDELTARMAAGVGALFVAEEALTALALPVLLTALREQPSWSDVPLIVTTTSDEPSEGRARTLRLLEPSSNITVLERPLRIHALVAAVQIGLRARRRQYQARDLLEQTQRALRFTDTFVGILSHDLRNPLSAITTGASLLALREETRALRPVLRILSSAERMRRMIDQLLDFTKIRLGGGLPLALEAVDLRQLCASTIEEFDGLGPGSGCEVELETRADLSGTWDRDRLAQMLSNIVGNACSHGAPGTPVHVVADGGRAESVRLTISNAGGIPRERIGTIFEPLHGERKDGKSSGLGLGLFISSEIARAHGGTIHVESSESATCFTIDLPRRPRTATPAFVVGSPPSQPSA